MSNLKDISEKLGDMIANIDEKEAEKINRFGEFYDALLVISNYASEGFQFEIDDRRRIGLEYGLLNISLYKLKQSNLCTNEEIAALTAAETAASSFVNSVNRLRPEVRCSVISDSNPYAWRRNERQQKENLKKIAPLVLNQYKKQIQATSQSRPQMSEEELTNLLLCHEKFSGQQVSKF